MEQETTFAGHQPARAGQLTALAGQKRPRAGQERLGEKYRSKIDGLGGFDAKMLDEAKVVAAELRDRPAIPVVLGDEAARALALRNRLAMLLAAKMNAVRSAARFVFRHRPEIVREATSAYERRRRAAARRNALRKGPSGDE